MVSPITHVARIIGSVFSGKTSDHIKSSKETTENTLTIANTFIDNRSINSLLKDLTNQLNRIDENPDIKENILDDINKFKNNTIATPTGSNDPNIELKQLLSNLTTKLTDFQKRANNTETGKNLNQALERISNFQKDNTHLTKDRGTTFSRTQFFTRRIGVDLEQFEEKNPRIAKAVDTLTDGIKKVPSVIFSQTTGRGLFLAATIGAVVVSGGTLAIASAALAATSIAVGVGFQVRKLNQLRNLHEENNLLTEYKNEVSNHRNIDPNLKHLVTDLSDPQKIKSNSFDSKLAKKDANFLTTSGSFIRDNIGETGVSVALSALTLNPAIIAVTAGSALLSSAAGIIDRKNADMKMDTIKKNIDHLREQISKYSNITELKNNLKLMKLENAAFKKLSSEPNFNQMSSEEKQLSFLNIKSELAKDPQFTPEQKPSMLARIGNTIKNVFADIGKVILMSPFKDPLDQIEEKSMEKHKTLLEESKTEKTIKSNQNNIVRESIKEAAQNTAQALAAGTGLLLASGTIPGAAIIGATSTDYAVAAGTCATLVVGTSATKALISDNNKTETHVENSNLPVKSQINRQQKEEHTVQKSENINHKQQYSQPSLTPPSTPSAASHNIKHDRAL